MNDVTPLMRRDWLRWAGVAARATFAFGALVLPARAQPPQAVDFAHDVIPLLKARCGPCHTNGTYKGSFSLDTRADVLKSGNVVPGKSAESELVRRITSADPKTRMPLKGDRLSAREVALLKAWIDQGLKWEDGFTFQVSAYSAPLKPRWPTLPPARAGREHPIDRILDGYFARHQLSPPAAAEDAAFSRRSYLDVIGLLPTPEEVDAFVKDSSPDKQARLARRLLAEKRAYTEHWLTFWNDLLRNDDGGIGYRENGRKTITAWLYGALWNNKPYDQLVRELISPSGESEGFIHGIQWRGKVNASQTREVQFAQNVSQVFFGVNLKCASCHDSFINHWKLGDAYGVAAVIAEGPLELYRCDKATGRMASPRFLWPELGAIDPQLPKAKRLEQFARLTTHPDNGRFPRTIANRLWDRLMGRGLVHPVDAMANRPWSEDLLDYLAVYLSDNGYDLKKLIEHIITSRAYQARAALRAKQPLGDTYVFRGPEVKRLTAEQFLDAVWQITRTAPIKQDATVQPPAYAPPTPSDRRFVRAALVNADALMRSLGRPNRDQVVTARGDVLTTLQALDLSNGEILNEVLIRGAAHLLNAHPKAAPEQFSELIYQKALGRRPTAAELATARELVGTSVTTDGLADLLWAVFMLPEFQLIR
jgi:mono/diheme cytochrome c family protein